MRFLTVHFLAGLVLCSIGCRKPEVTYYEIPKEKRPGPSSEQESIQLPEGHPVLATPRTASSTGPSQPSWKVPDSWNPGPPSQLRVASFLVHGTEGQTVDISITTFPGEVGGALLNINRWRRQIGLDPIPAQDVSNYSTELDIAENRFHLVDLHNDEKPQGKTHPQSSLIATLSHQGNSWFFKISGDAPLVDKQRETFLEFLGTVKFE